MGANAQMAVMGGNSGVPRTMLELAPATDKAALAVETHPAWPILSNLPVSVAVNIPLRGFRVRSLLSLRCGETVQSTWLATEDVPLKVGALQLCWGEFEVVHQQMALRLTRLA